jgi:alpha-D-ribose 1-methylphosphonate 5-triphosphate diphosphatase
MNSLFITGGQVLTQADGLVETSVGFADGRISMSSNPRQAWQLDATNCLVLPGIVDIHGDAFERQLQPRPGVDFSAEIALQDTQAQLLANGITTAFLGMTLSWEPGLRGVSAWSVLLDALAKQAWVCDLRVHLRWEAFNIDALDVALRDIAEGRVHLVAFNDHTPSILRKLQDPVAGAKYGERAGMSQSAFRALADHVASRETEVPEARARMAAASRAQNLPMASHDDATLSDRLLFRELGARICEFPMSEDIAVAAREAGDAVVMGSPNVVRGGSHLGWASAARLAENGICNVLSSDYYYPAMLQAAFVLADRGILNFAAAWALVSRNPAMASGLADRGAITEGLRGDVIVVDAKRRTLVATIVAGRIAHLNQDGWARLRNPA